MIETYSGPNRPKAVLDVKDGRLILDPNRVRRFQKQPRQWFDPAKMTELEISILNCGQEEPIKVTPITDDPDHDFELVDGERRLITCKKLDILIEAILEPVTSVGDQFKKSFVSNLPREGHAHLEIAEAIEFLMEQENLNPAQVAALVGKSETWARQHLALLTLPKSVQAMMHPSLPKDQQLGIIPALEIAKLPRGLQESTARTIVQKRMKVRQAREHITGIAKQVHAPMRSRKRGPNDIYRNMERLLDDLPDRVLAFSKLTTPALFILFKDRPKGKAEAKKCIEQIKASHARIKQLYEKLLEVEKQLE